MKTKETTKKATAAKETTPKQDTTTVKETPVKEVTPKPPVKPNTKAQGRQKNQDMRQGLDEMTSMQLIAFFKGMTEPLLAKAKKAFTKVDGERNKDRLAKALKERERLDKVIEELKG